MPPKKEWLKEQVKKYGYISEISRETGYPETTLRRWFNKYDLIPPKARESTDRVTKEFLIQQYKQGKKIKDISNEYHLSTATIVLKNKELNISPLDFNHRYLFNNKEWLEEQFKKYKTI